MNCKHRMHLSDSRIKHFTTKVWQFSPKRTDFPIYHCTAQRLRMTCHESFFGHKANIVGYHLSLFQDMSANEQCLHTLHVKLHKHSHGEWRTSSPDKYSCSWMKTKSCTYIHFKMVAYPAQLKGSDHLILQHVTHTHCNYRSRHCTPKEMPKSQIVWNHVRHDFRNYHPIGRFPAQQLDDYILVPKATVGGTIVKRIPEDHLLYLDSGFVVTNISASSHVLHDIEKDMRFLKKNEILTALVKDSEDVIKLRLQNEILNVQLAALNAHERSNMISAWENICLHRQQMYRIHRWMIQRFPTSSSEWIAPAPGYIISPQGDAYLMSQCHNITQYEFFWNRTYNGTCYAKFPVFMHVTQHVKFLQLTDHRIQAHSPVLNCGDIPKSTYVTDVHGNLWLINQNATISPVNYTKIFLPSFSNHILKLPGVNSHLLHYVDEPLDEFSLLDILARSQDTLDELQAIQSASSDSIALDIGRVIGSTFTGIGSGGSHIVKALGSALHDGLSGFGDLDSKVIHAIGQASGTILTSSGKAIESTGKGAGSFFHQVIGGLSGSLLWGALLLLSLFLAYTYIRRTRCYTKRTKQATTDDYTSSISNNDDEPNSVHELDQFSVYEPEECVDCGRQRSLSQSCMPSDRVTQV